MQVIHVDTLDTVEVAPGILRRSLPATGRARGWLIDFAPGSEWPAIDVQEGEERYFVLDGEILEGDRRHPPGSHVTFAQGSCRGPRSVTGGRILGINVSMRGRLLIVDVV